MTISHLDASSEKSQIESSVKSSIAQAGYKIIDANFEKPWGGYFVIDEKDIEKFVKEFFVDIADELLAQVAKGFKLTPKVLVVAPQARLSWQYHFRRSEEWTVISADPVGAMMSQTDEEPAGPQVFAMNQRITLGVEQRHRLIGLDTWGVVAEVWRHTDPKEASNEEDIVRVQDDYQRK